MIPKVKELKLIFIYLYICDIYDSKLRSACERFSNNNNPEFTDQEVLTIYLYSMNVEQRLKIKQIHEYASDHLRSWFSLLQSYEAFVMRINRLTDSYKTFDSYCFSISVPIRKSDNPGFAEEPILACKTGFPATLTGTTFT